VRITRRNRAIARYLSALRYCGESAANVKDGILRRPSLLKDAAVPNEHEL
jgi:hypothetical protein